MSTHSRQDKLEVVSVGRVSFATGEQGAHRVYFPYSAQVVKIRTRVTTALGAIDAGTITGGNATGASANGVLTHPLSAAFGNEQTASPTTNNTVVSGSYYELVSAKTTAGGAVFATLEIVRSAL